jgi:hypothetical protein
MSNKRDIIYSSETGEIRVYYSRKELEELKRKERQSVVQQYQYYRLGMDNVFSEAAARLSDAAARFSNAYSNCIQSVLFADSPTYTDKLLILRDVFNLAYDNMGDTVQYLRTNLPGQLIEAVGDIGVQLELSVYDEALEMTSYMGNELKQALAKAIQGDTSDLIELHSRRSDSDVRETLLEHAKKSPTAHIAQGTKIQRYTVYIGTQALKIQEKGVTNLTIQWKSIYRDLTARISTLNEDERAAYDYITDLKKIKTPREINKIVHKCKETMRRYQEDFGLSNGGQSRDTD